MRTAMLAAALGTVVLGTSSSQDLRVLRTAPDSPADRNGSVLITFDRPVAGDLERSVDPTEYFRIAPPVSGEARWRDPVTLVFEPDSVLPHETTFVVTVLAGLEAVDGSRLRSAHTFEFTTAPAKVLDGFPVGPYNTPEHLEVQPVFQLAVDSPVEGDWVAARTSVQTEARCGGQVFGFDLVSVRYVDAEDERRMYRLRRRSGPGAAEGRRIVELRPERPLPGGCTADLRLPLEYRDQPDRTTWRFKTRGALAVKSATCGGRFCPTGPLYVEFSNPVRGDEVLRHVSVDPPVAFQIPDTTREATGWRLMGDWAPRTTWTVSVRPGVTDVFGGTLDTGWSDTVSTTEYEPLVSYEHGRQVVELGGPQTLAIQHLNVDTLVVERILVPDSLEPRVLRERWGLGGVWQEMASRIDTVLVPVEDVRDQSQISGFPLDARASGADGGTLQMIQVSANGARTASYWQAPIAMLQVTDLAVHSRVGVDEAAVWVTDVSDGSGKPGATVTLYGPEGDRLARGVTDQEGILILRGLGETCDDCAKGYLTAELDGDRAVISLDDNEYDLSPWAFGGYRAWGIRREPIAASVFTERGIYRPGEPVYAKAVVRDGALGQLKAPASDSLKWVFYDRDGGVLSDSVVVLSRFGTSDRSIDLPEDGSLGTYRIEAQLHRRGKWTAYGSAYYRVAEYRPPEFLVDAVAEQAPRFAGDSVEAVVSGRYLFGAPMKGMRVTWQARREPVSSWALRLPGFEGWQVGASYRWWEDSNANRVRTLASSSDSLDADGRLALAVPAPAPEDGRAYRLSTFATVTDLNRQTATASTSVFVHPAAVYVGARQRTKGWFWEAGDPVDIEVMTASPEGERRGGVTVDGALIRWEWHSVERNRNGVVERVGSWVQDTVATCTVVTEPDPGLCRMTPPAGGSYQVAFRAEDEAGRFTETSFNRWARGEGWVPWNDRGEFKMDVIVDKEEYDVGDTATVMLAAPFTSAEAWLTIERERVLESRRIRIEEGATTLQIPITEAHAPNVFVSVLMVRGRVEDFGSLQDPGRPTMRLGYAELKVKPDVKRLQVALQTDRDEYRPRDTVRVNVAVGDINGAGQASEVTLWAVDEGVLALTGYQTPDPLDLLYPRRGLGMYLASNLVAVAPQVPEGQKAAIAPGGGGGGDAATILRSRFKTTAFFLGSVETEPDGTAQAEAVLPDNLTTFRLMAVAVTEGDRYGAGETDFLVSLPLLARPALPRFVRPTDRFSAGVVVNSRMPEAADVDVGVDAAGIELTGDAHQTHRLEALGGADARFGFLATEGDSASFTFSVEGGGEADAVRVGVPVEPMAYPIVATSTGVLEDPVSTAIVLDDDIDLSKARVEISFGSSPLAFVRGARRRLTIYPYYCSEQVGSRILPLIALHRAGARTGSTFQEDAAEQIQEAVRILTDRQQPAGAIGYWRQGSWTTPTVTAYAGRVLLEAKDAGFEVPDSVLTGIGDYLSGVLSGEFAVDAPVYRRWWSDPRWRLGESVHAVDFLSRVGRPDIPAENSLLQNVSNLSWDARLRLAEMFGRRGEIQPARMILTQALEGAQVEGRQLILSDEVEPDERGYGYFYSRVGHVARLVEALMVVAPRHPMLGPAVERLVGGARSRAHRWWTTYDQGQAILALVRYDESLGSQGPRQVSALIGGTPVELAAGTAAADTSFAVGDLMEGATGRVLPLYLERTDDGPPIYYYVTLSGPPPGEHPNPSGVGLEVERWYENPETGEPITEAQEGDLVRVMLRVTTSEERGFVVLDDPLPAGLEVVDLSLKTVGAGGRNSPLSEMSRAEGSEMGYGWWEYGYWSPWDHKEMRDERAVYSATLMRPGTHVATYLARATTAGAFLYPPAYAEEMYNPGVNGRSGGGRFTVRRRAEEERQEP